MDSTVKGRSEIVLQIFITAFLGTLALAALLPFILLVVSSFTDEAALMQNGYGFWPSKFSLYAYEYLFSANAIVILRAYGITLLVTSVGTTMSLIVAPMLAYPLSRADYKRSRMFTFLVFFTMLFNGGIVPSYIMWTQVFGIKDTIAAYLFPGLLFNGFYIILYKTNFRTNIHPALVEAAKIDGANEFYIYRKIVLPISLPILATIGLMNGISYWNDWVNGLYYISNAKLYSLQVYLNNMINNIRELIAMASLVPMDIGELPAIGIRMAIAVIGTLPILILYPFFQKAFIAGITLGGVKE